MTVKRLAAAGLFAAVALGIHAAEAQLPPLAAIPGVKPGLANAVTLAALYLLGRREAGGILLTRVILGSIFAGQAVSFLYSLGGGTLAFLVMAPLSGLFPRRQIWVVSVFGALAHNAGQLIVAALVLQSAAVLVYAPHMLVAGIVAGAFTGLCTQYAVIRCPKFW